MGNYILNMRELTLKEAVRGLQHGHVYYSIGKHNTVTPLNYENLPFSIYSDAKYYAGLGLVKVEAQ